MAKCSPEITVVIPTRDRARTLFASLKTCLSQDYDALRVVVSDNASQDSTKDVVFGFSDPRVTYVNTGRRISMARNWEFALAQVKRGFVTYLGDDDGLLPNAIADLSKLIDGPLKSQAIAWTKAEYHWPDHPDPSLRNILSIPVSNVLFDIQSNKALSHALSLWLPYNRLPTLYNSLVSVDCINRARGKNGVFFNSVTPDVYSGFALLKSLGFYLYSSRPFSVNGASASSNGTSAISGAVLGGEAARFMGEVDIPQHKRFQVIPGAIYSNIAEAALQASDHCYESKIDISNKSVIKLIIRDLYRYLPGRREQSLNELYRMAELCGLLNFAKSYSLRLQSDQVSSGMPSNNPLQFLQATTAVVDAQQFSINDIEGACNFVGRLLPYYSRPVGEIKYSIIHLLRTSRLSDFSHFCGRVSLNAKLLDSAKKVLGYYIR